MTKTTIAIIGGGASATLLLAHLMKQADIPPTAITIYDREGAFGRGIAYATRNPAHLLNVRAIDISGFQDEPRHFVEWLAAYNHKFGPDDFVPRMIYGDYLGNLLRESVKAAEAQGHEITLEQNEGMDAKADIVVLATGNDCPITPPGGESLTTSGGYHGNPWNADYLAMAAARHVVILGTGLSMVDAVLSLEKAMYKGKITAISLKGLLPAVHAGPRMGIPPLDAAQLPRTAFELLQFTRARVKQAAKENIPWQAVINSLRPITNKLWLEMGAAEQEKFRRHLMPFWMIHRHRMAPEAATVIHRLIDEKRLIIRRDTVRAVAPGPVIHGRKGIEHADHVINCLGYGASPAKPDNKRVFALGPALSATLLETTAIPEIRQASQHLAGELGNLLKTRR